jgi:hypothetical protein
MEELMEKDRKIIAIVFENNRPFSVVTDDSSIFDVEFCKADGTLYFNSCGNYGIDGNSVYLEGGRVNDFWLAKRFSPNVNPGEGMGSRLQTINPKWLWGLESWGCESDTIYCKICDDHIPTNDVCEAACDHVRWDTDAGWWAGEGCDEG